MPINPRHCEEANGRRSNPVDSKIASLALAMTRMKDNFPKKSPRVKSSSEALLHAEGACVVETLPYSDG